LATKFYCKKCKKVSSYQFKDDLCTPCRSLEKDKKLSQKVTLSDYESIDQEKHEEFIKNENI